MLRQSCCLMVAVMIALSAALMNAVGVVVLTEEPVAEFRLPDGQVLRNAYVWRRTSQGIMIIHDDGQFFLNYTMMPDDWRAAYGVDASVEQFAEAASKRYDQYLIYPLLESVRGLSRDTVTFLESVRYHGQADREMVMVCALQALLDEQHDTALRLVGTLEQLVPEEEWLSVQTDEQEKKKKKDDEEVEVSVLDVAAFYYPCEACSTSGVVTVKCRACKGTGKCATCGGAGVIPSHFINKDPLPCVDCKGTGECPSCQGRGTRSWQCKECKGKGYHLNAEKVKTLQKEYIKKLHDVRDGKEISHALIPIPVDEEEKKAGDE